MRRWFEPRGWPAQHRRPVSLRVRGIVAHPGLCATRADAPRWSMQLTLVSWSVVGGWPQGWPLQIVGEADDEELRELQARCPEGVVVVADIALKGSSASLLRLVDVD